MENHQTSNSTNQDPNHVTLQIDSIYQELNVTLKTNEEDENE